jgi:hypothetical protein
MNDRWHMVRTHIISNASHELHEGKSEIAYILHYSPPDDQALVEVGLD